MEKLSVIFFIKNKEKKKNESGKDFEGEIYCKISYKNYSTTLSIKETTSSKRWTETAHFTKNVKAEREKIIKNTIGLFRNKLKEIYLNKVTLSQIFDVFDIKNDFLNKKEKQISILELCNLHLNDFSKLVESGQKAESTKKRYGTVAKIVGEFLKKEYKVNDLSYTNITTGFINRFDVFLRTERLYKGRKGIDNNTTIKYIRNFGSIINHCTRMEYIPHKPHYTYTKKLEPVKTVFLTEEEVFLIINKEFENERLNVIKDLFLFTCYTSYGPSDSQKLTKNNLIKQDGMYWIFTDRIKTGIESNTPLLDIPLEIINKYKNYPLNDDNQKLLPQRSSQKVNDYLKEIADLCNINKKLSWNVGRHTFATMMLNRGISISVVSKIMGHTNLRQTQHYANLLTKTVANEMFDAFE